MHGYSGETILWDLRRPWLYILIGQYYQSNWLIIWICFRLNSECWWIAFFVLYCWPHASVSSKPHRDEGCGVGYNCLEGLLHAPAMLPLMLPEDSAIMSRAFWCWRTGPWWAQATGNNTSDIFFNIVILIIVPRVLDEIYILADYIWCCRPVLYGRHRQLSFVSFRLYIQPIV